MHVTCSGKMFGAYAVHGFGSGQHVFAGTYEHIRESVKTKWENDGWSVWTNLAFVQGILIMIQS